MKSSTGNTSNNSARILSSSKAPSALSSFSKSCPIDELLHQVLLSVLLAVGIQLRDLWVLAQIVELHCFRLKQFSGFGLTGANVYKLLDDAAGLGGFGFVLGELGNPKPTLFQNLQSAIALEQ